MSQIPDTLPPHVLLEQVLDLGFARSAAFAAQLLERLDSHGLRDVASILSRDWAEKLRDTLNERLENRCGY